VNQGAAVSADFMLALLQRGFAEERVARRLRERVDWADNVELRDRAKDLGWQIRQRLGGHRPDADPRTRRALGVLDLLEAALGSDGFDGYTTETLARYAHSLLVEADRVSRLGAYLSQLPYRMTTAAAEVDEAIRGG
jgi:hypothetical protein